MMLLLVAGAQLPGSTLTPDVARPSPPTPLSLTPDLSPEGREEGRASLLPSGEGPGMREGAPSEIGLQFRFRNCQWMAASLADSRPQRRRVSRSTRGAITYHTSVIACTTIS